MKDTTLVLLVEDDPNIVDFVRSNLMARGFAVIAVRTGAYVDELLQAHAPDIALIDLMLPDIDGFEVCRRIRERSTMGIIVVSARGAETDKVRALNLGADDYLTKPFGLDELLARVNATLRRSRPQPSLSQQDEPAVTVGDVTIDLASRAVHKAGRLVRLTPTEFAVLRELALHPGRLMPHAEILRNVWGAGYAANTEYVRVYVGRLRAKLEVAGEEPIVVNEPRAGYRMRVS